MLLAAPALVAALAITFAADHSAHFGLIVFGAFGLGTAVAGAITVALLPAGGLRIRAIIRAVLAAAAGALSLSALGWATWLGTDAAASAATLSWIIAGGLMAIAAVDLSTWLHLRGKDRSARDWISSAVILAVGAIAPLLVPVNYLLPYVVRDKDVVLPLELTASIMMVGITGAVLAILGVYYVIAGLSLLPARTKAAPSNAAPDMAVSA